MTQVRMRGIVKRFGGVTALRGVDLDIAPGEIIGLVGENGSGKSTLMRILAGDETPDAGEVVVDGHPLPPGDVPARLAAGVGVVFQEPNLCPELDVAENLFLGACRTSRGVVRWGATRQAATDVLDRAGIPLRAGAKVRALSKDDRHLTDVAHLLARGTRVLVLDETTASLTDDYVRRLFAIVRAERDRGTSVVFISHRLNEIFELCDRIAVLRDGELVAVRTASETDEAQIIRDMVGRALAGKALRLPVTPGDVRLSLDGVTAGRLADPLSFDVHAGETVGIGGLVGSGRSTVLEAIFGLRRRTGQITVDGRRLKPSAPRAAVAAGLGYVPEDRREHGLAMDMSVRANATFASSGQRAWTRRASASRDAALVSHLRERLALKAPDPDAPIRTLSGGNQQKVVLGRWLGGQPRALLLDEPTRGIDVGAKAQIYEILQALTEEGTAILLVSSELEELLGLADRTVVLREGRVRGWFGRDPEPEDVAVAMAGSAA
ncbi:ribose import ATP-binding protein RbsA [Asanoa ishikariensis]|uniref:Ribose transport system ATP-binding protein/rhamnose transport system ATP-binding protein n=1 Tax=Asanoa ishikariensis TaxID=137265 RepID=A0A1H3UAR3_9ACTN|nr:sugar ABC transporter ATP-binding protein [Asanoa ishikariensis]GIF63949.1 ribose import ATP-binding protein RbsA [Asanoa ishikariensis]SDZ59522.1 ribose transport system ATP-binding protein/rhamnose transport system ATP-binding protein [Asanoa ishikariensis]